MSVFSFVLSILKKFRIYFSLLVSINLVWAVELSLKPYLIKLMLNEAAVEVNKSAQSKLLDIIFLYIFFSISMECLWRLYDWCCLKFYPPIKKQVGIILMSRMLNHSHSFYQEHFVGNLTNRINDVMKGIPKILRIFIEKFVAYTAAAIVALYTFWNVHPIFSITLGIWLTIFLFLTLKMAQHAQKLSHNVAFEQSNLVGSIVDILGNILNIRFFNTYRLENKQLDNRFSKVLNLEQKRDKFFIIMYTVQGFSFIMFFSFCLWWLYKGLQNGTVTPGDFALILSLSISIVDNMWGFGHEMGEFAALVGEVKQGLYVTHVPFEIQDKPGAEQLVINKGRIHFKDVCFGYKKATPIFQKLNVTIEPGQKVGLVGYSGSGKSTFANLILRLFDLSSGEIVIDDQNIKNISQSSLRKAISIIPQEPVLFHRTLMENILYAMPGATIDEALDASKKAYVHDFVDRLPQGYDTTVGERGLKLSGGQRQRIAIARAILKNSPILILDEATSQLDSITENFIQDSLWNLMKNKTTLVIAHRLSTLLRMDRILVFKDGKIIEDGTHQELVAMNGLYKELWDAQIGGFLPSEKDKPLEIANIEKKTA